ncbi:MAG: hypothetical protein ACI9K3_001695, partial [Halovenus sp.]
GQRQRRTPRAHRVLVSPNALSSIHYTHPTNIIFSDERGENHNSPGRIEAYMNTDQWIAIFLVVIMVVSGISMGAVAVL